MKKIIVILTLFFVLGTTAFGHNEHQETNDSKKHVLKLRIANIHTGNFKGFSPLEVTYEYMLTDRFALLASPYFAYTTKNISARPEFSDGTSTVTIDLAESTYVSKEIGSGVGTGLTLEPRYYWQKTKAGAQGWYTGALLTFDFVWINDVFTLGVTGGPEVGYQWILGQGFVIDLGLGYQAGIATDDDVRYLGYPKLNTALGWAF